MSWLFSNELALHIRWPKYWIFSFFSFFSYFSFSFNTSPSNEYPGWISFRIDWFDLLAVQRTLAFFIFPSLPFSFINNNIIIYHYYMLVLLDLYFTLLYTIYYHYIYALLIPHFLYSVSMFRSLVISWVLNSAWNGVSSNIYLLHPSAKGKYLK